jgi:protein-disulfide isomerase
MAAAGREQQRARGRAEREARELAQQRAQRRRRRLLQLGAVVAVAALVVAGLAALSQRSTSPPNASSGAAVAGVAEADAMLRGVPQNGSSLGDPKAPVVLTEFADLQCPFCRDYTLNVLPQIIERYLRTGRLRLDLRLQRFIGPDSDRAARVAQAAATRDRMWNFVDLFYRNQGAENSGFATDAFLSRVGRAAGLRASLILDATTSQAFEKPLLEADAQARAAGLTSTPSFLIGPQAGRGRVLSVSSLDIGAFATAIDPELRR